MLLAAVGPAVKVYGGQAGNAQPSSSLPFTGFDLWLLAAGGLAILALGLLLRLYGRRTATKRVGYEITVEAVPSLALSPGSPWLWKSRVYLDGKLVEGGVFWDASYDAALGEAGAWLKQNMEKIDASSDGEVLAHPANQAPKVLGRKLVGEAQTSG